MVRFSEAYDFCRRKFIDDGYEGVGTIYQTDEAWVFWPSLSEPEYGTLPIVFPRDGKEPFFYDWSIESQEKYLDKAIVLM